LQGEGHSAAGWGIDLSIALPKRQMKHSTAKVPEQVNRKCRLRNAMVQLSIPYTHPISSNYRS